MDLAAYRAVTRPVVVDFEGEILNLACRPNVFTLGYQRRINEAMQQEDFEAVALTFLDLVASWDLMDGGKVVPLDRSGIADVPIKLLGAITAAVADELLPSEEEKGGSSEPSATPPSDSAAPAETSQNGSETLSSPTASESVPTS